MNPKRQGNEAQSAPDDSTIAIKRSGIAVVPGKPVPEKFDSLVLPGYEIVSLLGRGGMGFVFLARQSELERYVAVKMLSPKYGRDAETVARLHREAKALASLNHPSIVGCHDVVRDGDRLFVVMDYVPGQLSVGTLSKRYGPLPEHIAAKIVLETARALAYCLDKGIIHRDIKPSNLLVFHDCEDLPDTVEELLDDEQSRIMIADFGLAKTRDQGDADATYEGQVMGTPAFMSPEQAEGKQVDHRTDIYALGATFFRLLTGRNPFQADTPEEALRLRLTTDLPDVGQLNTKLSNACTTVLRKMTDRDPARRYQNYRELINDLNGLQENGGRRHRQYRLLSRRSLFVALTAITIPLVVWSVLARQPSDRNLSNSLRHWSGAEGAWELASPDDTSEHVMALVCQRPGVLLSLNHRVLPGSDVCFTIRLPGSGRVTASLRSDGQSAWEFQWSRTRAGEQVQAGPVDDLSPIDAGRLTDPSEWYKVRIRTSAGQVLLYLDEALVAYQRNNAITGPLEFGLELNEGHLVQIKDMRIISPQEREEIQASSGNSP